jgi:hypothetical protein
MRYMLESSVADPHQSDPAGHFDADLDLDPVVTLMRIWIWILLVTLMRIRIRFLPFSLIRIRILTQVC